MEPISAIATAQGRGGVAVVRVSGEGALEIARGMFSRKGEYAPNMMYAGEIDCGGFSDYGLCVYFRAPKSFTGEDVVEFHCHGGAEIARGALARTLSLGARLAERGEFTKRAFLNGKLSLSACEGMGEMIAAESAAEVRAGYSLYLETLTKEAKRLSGLLTECLASVEADVDFPEEDLERESREAVKSRLLTVKDALAFLRTRYEAGRKIKSGVNVVIAGAPNAGKSSLLNALLGYERAIVSSIEGTTRDAVEGVAEIRGVKFNLTDTAGLRETADEIEREGVRRAERAMKSADLVLWLKDDISSPPETNAPVLTVGAKCDLMRRTDCEIVVSSVTGEGIEALKELIYLRTLGKPKEGAYLLEARHFEALGESLEAVNRALTAVEELPAELYAEDLRAARIALGKISGETATEAVISEIFEKFCVGK